jgi:ClpP class serine protease
MSTQTDAEPAECPSSLRFPACDGCRYETSCHRVGCGPPAEEAVLHVDGDGIAHLLVERVEPWADRVPHLLELVRAGQVRGFLVEVDCCGGVAVAADRIASFLTSVRWAIPSVAWIRSAFSAGLEVATGALRVYASPGAWLGSVGTALLVCFRGELHGFAWPEEKRRVLEELVPRGPFDFPYTEEWGRRFQDRIEAKARAFLAAVERRRVLPKGYLAKWADADVRPASEAERDLLVDELCSRSDARLELLRLIEAAEPNRQRLLAALEAGYTPREVFPGAPVEEPV